MHKLIRTIFFALLIVILLQNASFSATEDQSYAYYLAIAQEAFSSHDLSTARKNFQKALVIDPSSKEAEYYLNLVDKMSVHSEQSRDSIESVGSRLKNRWSMQKRKAYEFDPNINKSRPKNPTTRLVDDDSEVEDFQDNVLEVDDSEDPNDVTTRVDVESDSVESRVSYKKASPKLSKNDILSQDPMELLLAKELQEDLETRDIPDDQIGSVVEEQKPPRRRKSISILSQILEDRTPSRRPLDLDSSTGTVPDIEAMLSDEELNRDRFSSSSVNDVPIFEGVQEIYLNDELQVNQSKVDLKIIMNTRAIVSGSNIQRFLVLTPGFIEVERIDRDNIQFVATARGSTFIHVWDDQGRWTFNAEVIFPVRTVKEKDYIPTLEQKSSQFRFSHAADFTSFNVGDDFTDLSESSRNIFQWAGIEGETPYGNLDSSVVFNTIDDKTDINNFTIGLRDATIGPMKDVHLRAFDANKGFSSLSLPGRNFRGFLAEGRTKNDALDVTYIRGRERSSFGVLTSNASRKKDAYVEGVRMELFPTGDYSFAVNAARGFGDDRPDFLKDEVYSLENKSKLGPVTISSEFATDTDETAKTVLFSLPIEKSHFRLKLRDIDEQFTTITSYPSNRGEIGALLNYDWKFTKWDMFGYLDLYRERYIPNEDDPNAINVDANVTTSIPFNPDQKLTSSLYYVDTPGERSPRQNVRMISNYSHRFKFKSKRDLLTSFGVTYQRSRFTSASVSEYDRFSLLGGLRFSITKHLSYYANYEYSWVDEITTGQMTNPNVLTMGLNAHQKLAKHWYGNSSLQYRNEQGAEGTNSFLAGEDSISLSLGAAYRPSDDFEFYVDGRIRNVWAERDDNDDFAEVDFRTGIRTSWDLPFAWTQKGYVAGSVFKDYNRNQIQDEGEPGVAGVKVQVGYKLVETDENGEYRVKLRAKQARVELDLTTLPEGFVLSTSSTKQLDIKANRTVYLDFASTTHSGIYGVVYLDLNDNNKLDQDDKFVHNVTMKLDGGAKKVVTDVEGEYVFYDVDPGLHILEIDVNSLPFDYLPKVKIKKTIELKEGVNYRSHVPLKYAEE